MSIQEKMFLTSVLLTMLFIGAIKIHGDDRPVIWLTAIEVVGAILSILAAVISAMFIIWC